MKKNNRYVELKNYFYVSLGAILLAIVIVTFLAPNHIAPGGTPGVAVIINYVSGLQIGALMLIINIPMIFISVKFINKAYALRTIYSICVTGFSVDIIRELIGFQGLIIEPILASIYSGVIVGIAIGFILKGNASPGGPSVVSRIISQKTKFKESHILVMQDAFIVIFAGIIFKNIEITLLSLITVYLSSKGIDVVLSGRAVFKMVHISTKKAEFLSGKIVKHMNIRGTIIEGIELDLIEDKKVILLLIDSNRIIELKDILQKYDEESFMVIADASEIMGRGH